MFSIIKKQLKPAYLMLLWMTLLTGLAYPLAMTGIARMLFPDQAEGSLIRRDGAVVGSRLVGRDFASPGSFHGRPSATAPYAYNAAASTGSNLGPTNPALADAVAERKTTLAAENGGENAPMDLLTASGSGLDPHISPEAAAFQVPRVAKARHLSQEVVAALVERNTEGRLWGLWGEPRVNVLGLNLALDALTAKE
ncbi:MAG: potassium-transporting ATPase subunit KdpC [Desulfovibrionaceae bacterium]|nr:potassium-transporting ATPase subunit KdpC [Desulfovibrionaceae bacterium]